MNELQHLIELDQCHIILQKKWVNWLEIVAFKMTDN